MEEWIKAIRAGDEDVLQEKFLQYKPVVLSQRNKITLRFHELDDWLQEGMIIFHKSVMNYADDRGVTFGLYFKGNLARHCISLLRKEQAMKRRGDIEATHIENNAVLANNNFKMDNDTNVTDYANYVMVAEKAKRFGGKLSPFEAQVFELYLNNIEMPQIGMLLNCSEKKVKSTVDRVCRKFKIHLYEND